MSDKAKELYLPIGLVITILIVVVGGAWSVSIERAKDREYTTKSLEAISLQIGGVGNRISAIEASRFTVSDGHEVWKEIALLRERMASGDPSPWLKSQFDQINGRFQRMEDDLKRIKP